MFDSLEEELTTDDIVNREKAMDKEFVKLVQAACKESNIPRAIELAKLLHNTTAFDFVIQIADFYHLPGLKEKMCFIKAEREEAEDRLILARSKRRRWLKPEPPLRQLAVPSISATRFDPLGDSRPPPVIDRPGMARVTVPVIEPTRYSSMVPASQTQGPTPWIESTAVESSPLGDAKRKRDLDEDSYTPSESLMPPPKQSSSSTFISIINRAQMFF
jgi:chromosome transmission fidelity protein 4